MPKYLILLYKGKLPIFIKHHTFFFFILICFFTNTSNSQTCIPVYKKLYGSTGNDEAKDILYTIDKGAITVGRTSSNTTGNYDAFVMKLDEQGTILWSKQIGGNADDDLRRIKTTSDGGYIAIGNTKSFGNSNGEVFIVKLDNGGTVLWARHYGNIGMNLNAREIIQLSDNNFVFVANENDSSAQSNAMVCKLDVNGNILWTRTFDHGNADGFNYVMEDGQNLYVTGYASLALKDGILMQLNKSTGNILFTNKYKHRGDYQDEILNIYKIQNGIAFGAWSFNPANINSTVKLTLFKMRNNGQVFFRRGILINTTSGYKIAAVNFVANKDSGFTYVAHDTTPNGYGLSGFMSPTGNIEGAHGLHPWPGPQPTYTCAIDETVDGYLFAGHVIDYATGPLHKIAVFKTNKQGFAGNCVLDGNGNYGDTSTYDIQSFTWNTVSTTGLQVSGMIVPATANAGFGIMSSCQQNSCTNGPPIPPSCNTTFNIKYKSDRAIMPWDIIPANDGGSFMIGEYKYAYSLEAYITKLKPNGDVQWAKTLNNYAHLSAFKKALLATDGNLVIMGMDHAWFTGGYHDSTIFMKINSNTGDIMWSHYYVGFVYDFTPTNDGGYILSIKAESGITNLLERIDASGIRVWRRNLHNTIGDLNYRSITFAAPYVYIGADYNKSTGAFFQVMKLDASTGTKIWTKAFTIPNQHISLQDISMVADTLCVAIDQRTFGSASVARPAMICLNSDGSSLRSFEITSPDFSLIRYNQNYNFFNEEKSHNRLKTSDNCFLVADQTVQGNDTSFSIIKYKQTGQVLWSRKYPNMKDRFTMSVAEKNNHFFITGIANLNLVNLNYVSNAYLLKTDSAGKISDALSGECYSELITANTAPVTLASFVAFDDSVTVNTQNDLRSYIPYQRPINIWADLSCSVQAVCSFVNVMGISSTCSLSDTITYAIQRSPGCQLPVNWQIAPLHANIISFTDTTISVQYILSGQTYIIANLLTPCGIFADTLLINVMRNASSLDLGTDTTICEQNTIVLKAGIGFKTYLWQNGSTADTLIVNTPGTYSVQVTDSCNNTTNDTILVTPHAPVQVNVGDDRVKCNNDTLQIMATAGFINYYWSPDYNISSVNAQTIIVNPYVDTSYYLSAEITPGCFAFDTIHITVNHSPVIDLGKDTSLCSGQSLLLNAGIGFVNYIWNTGNTGMQILANSAGEYNVTGTDFRGCKSYDTLNILNIHNLPVVNLDQNTELCNGSSRTLDAGIFSKYLWHDGSISRTFVATGIGNYYVLVTDINGCTGTDTSKIITILPLPENFLPADSVICTNTMTTLQPINSFATYLWNTNSTSLSIVINQPGIFWLQVNDDKNCTGKDSIIIQTKQCFKGLFVPNAFTPNGDTKNDKLRGLIFGSVESYEFLVYNRYGQIVFISKDPIEGWDGTLNGKKQNAGTYVWICKYKFINLPQNSETGTSVLIR